MTTEKDARLIIKSSDSLNFLMNDLQDLTKSENPLLSIHARDLLKEAAELDAKISRLVVTLGLRS